MRRYTSILLLGFFLFLFVLPERVEAKRQLPQVSQKKSTKTQSVSGSGRVGVSVKFRGDRNAIFVNFSNLSSAQSVSYQLIYTSNGRQEGAIGRVNPEDGDQTSRELLFGTCSKGVCRYHAGIKNARLTVTTTLSSGRKAVKTFRLRV